MKIMSNKEQMSWESSLDIIPDKPRVTIWLNYFNLPQR